MINFESFRAYQCDGVDKISGGIACDQIKPVIANLSLNGHHAQAAAVYNQWRSGGIQGCPYLEQ